MRSARQALAPAVAQATAVPWASVSGRVAGGIAAPGSLGSGPDSLPSPSSSDQPSGRADPPPVGEQAGLSFEQSGPPPLEPLVRPQPSVLLPCPALQVDADAPQEGCQRPVVPAGVVHLPGDDGVQPFRQVVQRQVRLPVDPQLAEPVAVGLGRLGADRPVSSMKGRVLSSRRVVVGDVPVRARELSGL